MQTLSELYIYIYIYIYILLLLSINLSIIDIIYKRGVSTVYYGPDISKQPNKVSYSKLEQDNPKLNEISK